MSVLDSGQKRGLEAAFLYFKLFQSQAFAAVIQLQFAQSTVCAPHWYKEEVISFLSEILGRRKKSNVFIFRVETQQNFLWFFMNGQVECYLFSTQRTHTYVY